MSEGNTVSGGKIWSPNIEVPAGHKLSPRVIFTRRTIILSIIFVLIGVLLTGWHFSLPEPVFDGHMTEAKWNYVHFPFPPILFTLIMPFLSLFIMHSFIDFSSTKESVIAAAISMVFFAFGVAGVFDAKPSSFPSEIWAEQVYNYEILDQTKEEGVEVKDLATGKIKIVSLNFIDGEVYLSDSAENLASQIAERIDNDAHN